MDQSKVAKGTEKFKAAVNSVKADNNNTTEEETESRINKKQLAISIGKVVVGVGALIAAYKIGATMATKDEDQQDENA